MNDAGLLGTRRTLLKSAMVGAAGGVVAPWVGSVEARAAAGVTSVGSERGMPVLSEGGLSEERLERLHEVMAGFVERGVCARAVEGCCRRPRRAVGCLPAAAPR